VFRRLGAVAGFVPPEGPAAAAMATAFRSELDRGRVLLVGLTAATHASGVAVVEATREGVRLLANHEEERFVGEKHFAGFPARSLAAARATLRAAGADPARVPVLAGWDYPGLGASLAGWFLEELPDVLGVLRPGGLGVMPTPRVSTFPGLSHRVASALGFPRATPILPLRHHDNHAWGAWSLSPFARSDEPVMVSVIDGTGDDGPLSLYLAAGGRLRRVAHTPGICDSLGALYALLSSTQGGWPPLSSEGRYMGAAAWGDGDRRTNPYYPGLRAILQFGPDGRITLDRTMVNFFAAGRPTLYGPRLTALLGPPIPPEQMWNPDAVLSVDAIRHAPVTTARVDKAAACQLVFEDALQHVLEPLVRASGSTRLVLAGGTALNCVANLRLLEHFDEDWYTRALGRRDARLHLWVPPVPGDAGVAAGAAFHFARLNGAGPGEPLQHAFLCGDPPTSAAIRTAVRASVGPDGPVRHRPLGDVGDPADRARIAALMAHVVAADGVLGLFQGAAETGPRALGHRSILANPCNPEVRALLNARVKHREAVRPLAPMATREAAEALFVLAPGAADGDWNAYRYMVLLARARPEAYLRVPAVVHRDGTARVQIVRAETDPLAHAYLVAMGRRVGVEVSVNTSLNVGAPIAQSPEQALATLHRARGMDGLVMVGADGDAYLVWTPAAERRIQAAIAAVG
jgi:carbamoyltransferase